MTALVAVVALAVGVVECVLIVGLAVGSARTDRASARAGLELSDSVPMLPWPRPWPETTTLPRAVVELPTVWERVNAFTRKRIDALTFSRENATGFGRGEPEEV